MGSDDESEKGAKGEKGEEVKVTQPSASSKAAPDFQGQCDINDHKKLKIKCPNCLEDIETSRKYKSGDYSKDCACNVLIQSMYFVGIFCAWMPFTFRNCKDIYHECPRCKHKIAVWKRTYCTCCVCCTAFGCCEAGCCYYPDRYGFKNCENSKNRLLFRVLPPSDE